MLIEIKGRRQECLGGYSVDRRSADRGTSRGQMSTLGEFSLVKSIAAHTLSLESHIDRQAADRRAKGDG